MSKTETTNKGDFDRKSIDLVNLYLDQLDISRAASNVKKGNMKKQSEAKSI